MENFNERASYVHSLLAATKLERYVYLGITGVSASVLLIAATVMITHNNGNASVVIPLFGSSGIITYSGGQILRVWSDAMKVVIPAAAGKS